MLLKVHISTFHSAYLYEYTTDIVCVTVDLRISNLQVCAEQNAFHLYKPQAVAARENKKIPKLRHLVTTEQDITFIHDMINGTWQMLCALSANTLLFVYEHMQTC